MATAQTMFWNMPVSTPALATVLLDDRRPYRTWTGWYRCRRTGAYTPVIELAAMLDRGSAGWERLARARPELVAAGAGGAAAGSTDRLWSTFHIALDQGSACKPAPQPAAGDKAGDKAGDNAGGGDNAEELDFAAVDGLAGVRVAHSLCYQVAPDQLWHEGDPDESDEDESDEFDRYSRGCYRPDYAVPLSVFGVETRPDEADSDAGYDAGAESDDDNAWAGPDYRTNARPYDQAWADDQMYDDRDYADSYDHVYAESYADEAEAGNDGYGQAWPVGPAHGWITATGVCVDRPAWPGHYAVPADVGPAWAIGPVLNPAEASSPDEAGDGANPAEPTVTARELATAAAAMAAAAAAAAAGHVGHAGHTGHANHAVPVSHASHAGLADLDRVDRFGSFSRTASPSPTAPAALDRPVVELGPART